MAPLRKDLRALTLYGGDLFSLINKKYLQVKQPPVSIMFRRGEIFRLVLYVYVPFSL